MALDSLRDGFVRLCFDPSANIVGDRCRMVVEGQKINTGTAVDDQLIKVNSTRDLATLFGAGSVIAEGLRVAMECCGNGGVEIFALPRR
ncbi:MAG: hypothetical protein ACRCYS_07835, partial [Beijerinckiaceae bacterium]